jgi:hypothetical protein
MRLLRLPVLALISTALLLIIMYVEQHADIGILSVIFLLFFLSYLVLAGIFFIAFLINISRRNPVFGLSALLSFGIMLSAAVWGQATAGFSFRVIDMIRFSISRDYYLQLVANKREEAQRFPWGAGGFLGTNFFYSLLYSPNGPAELRSSERSGCSSAISELHEKFYVESEICQ